MWHPCIERITGLGGHDCVRQLIPVFSGVLEEWMEPVFGSALEIAY